MPNVSLVANPERLQSAGLNAAVSELTDTGRTVVVRCDAHAIYPRGYVRNVADSLLSRPEAASVCSVLDSTGRGCFASAAAWVVDSPLGSGGSAHRGGDRSGWVDHGHHAGFRLGWFRRIGGYDPSFSHNEDAEYDTRLLQAGGKIWLDSSLRVGYVMRPNAAALMRQYWSYGCGRGRTVVKHRTLPRLRQIIPAANLLLQMILVPLVPAAPSILFVPEAYLAVLAGASFGACLSMRSVCGLWAGPALAIMHNAWGAGFLTEMCRSAWRARPKHGGRRPRKASEANRKQCDLELEKQ
jgi:succinoglycan biosynthesis protein ExoA